MKKRHHNHKISSTSSGGIIPLHENNDRQNEDHPSHKHKSVWKNIGKKSMLFVLPLLLVLLIGLRDILVGAIVRQRPAASDISRYGPRTNTTNKFVAQFEDVLLNDLGHDLFMPFIIEEGKLLCRRKHKQQLSRYRSRFFAQMVRKGLSLRNNHSSINGVDGGLPILHMDTDGNGCNAALHRDDYPFPRLAWSILSSKHGECNAIGVPSYETWKYYSASHKLEKHWERTFQHNERKYPWSLKMNKAVWRGSTTYEGSQYHQSELGDTPRGKLVAKSMEYPGLIDAAFHKIIQKFQSQRHELAGQFTVAKALNPMEMMKYKSIIDIDGNNWSSRFGMLLCSNSVVIKVEPDFIEYFYDDVGDVKPMVHYVPASLENITDVVEYVMEKKNEDQMKSIVKSANSWCKRALNEEGLATGAILQLEAYKKALDSYNGNNSDSWSDEWRHVKQQFDNTIGDLVDCNVW
eukprot:CAMPEP_0172316966 /NCGR_PEP_ID=MMETSP1058-20130122/30145_1 /TAXON_ID=83371 /ORGANISM="Detonula confervacea, Strain CCMP 353" /LENGTH=461 /DNA_ID=CAMNT_0013031409 /DNA_START=229 /DNA_END=1611 /DNA_ORIENTATION=-